MSSPKSDPVVVEAAEKGGDLETGLNKLNLICSKSINYDTLLMWYVLCLTRII